MALAGCWRLGREGLGAGGVGLLTGRWSLVSAEVEVEVEVEVLFAGLLGAFETGEGGGSDDGCPMFIRGGGRGVAGGMWRARCMYVPHVCTT